LIKIWDDLCAYGAWAFNKSHAVAYGLVSYWCCWLKAHHPVEFAAATLDAEKLPERQIAILRELESEGIHYLPFDLQHSTNRWEIAEREGKKFLVGPLTNIKGIGPGNMNEILECRAKGQPLRPALMKKMTNASTPIDTLYPITDKIKKLIPVPAEKNIVSTPSPIIDVQCKEKEYPVMVFAVINKIAPKNENEAVNVARRGGRKLSGPTAALNMFIKDDTDEMFCKVNRFDFERMGKEIIDRGRPGKSIYAIKGTVPTGFRMISVKQIRYIGDMDE
jgi:hypothetical protein